MRRKIGSKRQKNSVKVLCIVMIVAFTIIQVIVIIQLRNISQSTPRSRIGEFGEMVIKMLPGDLAFTLFLPSEEAIRRDLRLDRNSSSNSYAILTRILGFSAVPRWISSKDLEFGKPKVYDSISGFRLYVSKDLNEMAVVNGVISEQVNFKIGEIVVYVMERVVLDSEFEQSLHQDDGSD